ncbi:MAG: radical SAM protein [Hyphomicrobium sp.]|nr:radical SAM protein [Hyphomicrobium sp.]
MDSEALVKEGLRVPAEVLDAVALAQKFQDPDWTAKGERRAMVALERLTTLWINTGTLCNITCRNCYIESSPTNDRLAYMTAAEAITFLDEAKALSETEEIGFTGGEPFLNPEFLIMLEAALDRGFSVLVLTNAMLPMQRPHIKAGLLALNKRFGKQLTLRVSLDHFTQELHEVERGAATWSKTLEGIDWLAANGVNIAIAGRTCWHEDDATARAGYAALIAVHGWSVTPSDRKQLVLLPEMDAGYDGPEITTKCWDILHKSPSDMMCASSRMVVKRKGADRPVVLPCTLLPYDTAFEMGETLTEAARADGGMFAIGAVKLCHKNCAKFCVLGGGSCS